MLRNRKSIFSIIIVAVILTIGISGCSNKTVDKGTSNDTTASKEVNANNSSMENGVKTEDGLDKRYNDFLDNLNKEIAKNKDFANDERIKKFTEKVEKNLPIMKDLNRKSDAFCGSSFYVESVINSEGTEADKIIIKEYWQDGNYRWEQYNVGKLAYLRLYNKDEDINYYYETDKDLLKKTTKCTQKGLVNNSYQYGFFTLSNNALSGDFKTIDYNGKKVLYSLSIYEDIDQNGNKFKSESGYWYDAETGILLKEEQKSFKEGKLVDSNSIEYTVKTNQKFDEIIFKYDPNNKEAGDL
ncbi:hypothetical protein RBU61_10565 [Tissierella sp. MB52-C2]|uniref:hypothetical protein n=1 Tax=Tissierella sp. MB52-C2 TaxID=3070999 RepID=UPI00280BD238|nr:hypothetical protein [Tissierella sp. MB52-C2]WMM23398.1 hypothetical protein RBU61_10565 [Tissierella sp. MB52-C2]